MREGYTLLEVLICVLLIAILSGIGGYYYEQHVIKTRRADGELALLKLSTALENYYLMHNTYKGATFADLNFPMRSPQGFYLMTFDLLDDGQSYAAKAVPLRDQAKQDKACGILILYTDGRRSYEGNDLHAVCW